MRRQLRYGDQAWDALEEIERRDDEALLEAINDVLDLIEDGAGAVKRGPYDLSIEGTRLRGWMARTTVRSTTWVIVWSVVDEQWVKIHAITPSDTF